MVEIDPKFVTPFCLLLNLLSSIAIVYTNKVVFDIYSFKGSTTVTLIHFVVTFLGLLLCLACGMFKFKSIPIVKVLPISASFCGFVVLTNMSLAYNSVGFYQLIKVLTTPLLVLMESLIYKKTFSTRIKLSLALICVGVATATVNSAEVNFIGAVVALSALLVTCQYQIWVGVKQKELECDSFQLLFYQAPLSSLLLVPVAFITEPEFRDLKSTLYGDAMNLILLSGVIAFFVNISIFFVIGKTSPITYNVLGHFKLCVILFLGVIAFKEQLGARKLIGIFLTLSGVFWYTHLKLSLTKSKEEKDPLKTADSANTKENV